MIVKKIIVIFFWSFIMGASFSHMSILPFTLGIRPFTLGIIIGILIIKINPFMIKLINYMINIFHRVKKSIMSKVSEVETYF